MNKDEITLSDLISRLTNFINQLNIKENIAVVFGEHLESKSDGILFSALDGIHIYRTIQESINNTIKHPEANEINISIDVEEGQLIIKMQDDRKGFDVDTIESSNGLKNL